MFHDQHSRFRFGFLSASVDYIGTIELEDIGTIELEDTGATETTNSQALQKRQIHRRYRKDEYTGATGVVGQFLVSFASRNFEIIQR